MEHEGIVEPGDTVEGDDQPNPWRELARHMTAAMWVRVAFLALVTLGVVGAMLILAVLVTMIVVR
jgi:hypothetical protein